MSRRTINSTVSVASLCGPDIGGKARLHEEADEEGLTVSAYVEQSLARREKAKGELEALALEGLNSGPPIEVGPDYWQGIHRRLNERLNRSETK